MLNVIGYIIFLIISSIFLRKNRGVERLRNLFMFIYFEYGRIVIKFGVFDFRVFVLIIGIF